MLRLYQRVSGDAMLRMSCIIALGTLTIIPLTVSADTNTSLQYTADLRYRVEAVEQDGIDDDAVASTVRLRLGVQSARWHGFDTGAMFHGTRVLGNRLYNDTVNPVARPVVADPADTNLSQAWGRYQAGDAFESRVGRQRIIDDNARFIGNVGFRQLEQTFDAVTVDWRPTEAWQVQTWYLDQANRVFGPNHPAPLSARANLDTWVGILSHHFGDLQADLYHHRLAFEDRPASHENTGIRLHGALPGTATFSWRAEYARQSGLDDEGPARGQDYIRLALGQQRQGWRWFFGHERLGGDGDDAFQTPLATLHAHNGWADRFLTTPDNGLRDTWAGLATSAGAWQLLARAHDFRADHGGAQYGQELDLSAGRALMGPWQTEIKLALFEGEDGPPDTRKYWWTLTANW